MGIERDTRHRPAGSAPHAPLQPKNLGVTTGASCPHGPSTPVASPTIGVSAAPPSTDASGAAPLRSPLRQRCPRAPKRPLPALAARALAVHTPRRHCTAKSHDDARSRPIPRSHVPVASSRRRARLPSLRLRVPTAGTSFSAPTTGAVPRGRWHRQAPAEPPTKPAAPAHACAHHPTHAHCGAVRATSHQRQLCDGNARRGRARARHPVRVIAAARPPRRPPPSPSPSPVARSAGSSERAHRPAAGAAPPCR